MIGIWRALLAIEIGLAEADAGRTYRVEAPNAKYAFA